MDRVAPEGVVSVIRTTPDKIGKLLQRRAKAHEKGVRRAALSAAHRGKAMIGRYTPSDLGQLSLSWNVRGDAKGALLAELYNDAPHAGVVEMGARPHKVSAEGWGAIYEWVERHFPEARDEEGGVDAYGNDPEVSRITWAIVKKIGREGQKPTHFVKNRLRVFHEITIKEINHHLAKLAKKGKL